MMKDLTNEEKRNMISFKLQKQIDWEVSTLSNILKVLALNQTLNFN